MAGRSVASLAVPTAPVTGTGPSEHAAPTWTTRPSASGAAAWSPTTAPASATGAPGLDQHPGHPCADLVADHVVEVAAGGLASGPLRVLCRSENSRHSAWLATGLGLLVAAQLTTPPPAEVSDSLRARAALGARVRAGLLFVESLRELVKDGGRPLHKVDFGCFALRFSKGEQQPRTQVEQANDEAGWTRPVRVEFQAGDVVDGPLSVLQPQGQALDGDLGSSGCGVGLIHGQKLAR